MLQARARDDLVLYGGLSRSGEYRIWSEVKLVVPRGGKHGKSRTFDYTFDYVLAGHGSRPVAEVSSIVGKSERVCIALAEDNQYTLTRRKGSMWIDDFPAAPLAIVEVMSSSTSGGNKKKRTQIGMAFEDAMLKGSEHTGPGINYRQVWARMVRTHLKNKDC